MRIVPKVRGAGEGTIIPYNGDNVPPSARMRRCDQFCARIILGAVILTVHRPSAVGAGEASPAPCCALTAALQTEERQRRRRVAERRGKRRLLPCRRLRLTRRPLGSTPDFHWTSLSAVSRFEWILSVLRNFIGQGMLLWTSGLLCGSV